MRRPAAPSTAAPMSDADIGFSAWPDDKNMLPTCLFKGPSGGGKTHAIGRLIAAGFNVALVAVEAKYQSLQRYRDRIKLYDLSREPLTASEKWVRLRRLADLLAAGKFRAVDGSKLDIIAYDGLTELCDVIHADHKSRFTNQNALQMWESIGTTGVDYLKTLRDAACAGGSPIAIVATVGEKYVAVGMDARWEPLLPGKMTAERLPFQFEVIWRFEDGMSPDNKRVFRIVNCKSPAGLFPYVTEGEGVEVDGKPDAGVMFRSLLEDVRSPYCRATQSGVVSAPTGGGDVAV